MSTSSTTPEVPATTKENPLPQASASGAKPPTKGSRQRFKPQLSCTLCRTRKLKCDRQLPCANCAKRDLSSSCTFIHANLREKSSGVQKPTSGSKDFQSQIRRLEDLVVSLMNQTANNGSLAPENRSSSTSESSLDRGAPALSAADEYSRPGSDGGSFQDQDTAASLGRISLEDNHPNYVGSSHWAAILDNIAALKDSVDVAENPTGLEDPSSSSQIGPDLLVGGICKATRPEILSSIPARPVVDLLVQGYFGITDMGSSMVHRPTFEREYEKFWLDPSGTPIMWIGLLFAILCLATHFESMSVKNSMRSLEGHTVRDPIEATQIFREKTVQCLILGNYTEPDIYTIQTLILYYIADHFRTADTQFGAWMVFGLIVRAGMRLGLHRDASHYPKISVFRGEMQRRYWASILHLDLQTSLQVGLPRMVKEGMYDTQPPRNLLDSDFNQDTITLPAPRPESEITPIGYSNSKHRITKIFGMIVDQANSTTPISYDSVMKLDRMLHSVHQETPMPLKVSSVNGLQVGDAETRLRKFSVELTFQKARCVLHRKFFFPNKASSAYPYPYSMKACIEASMRILQAQNIMYGETLPGKPLFDHRWKASSLVSHDFLLAAMLVCLYLGHVLAAASTECMTQSGVKTSWTREEMLATLNGSYQIWEELSPTSKEAAKAAKTLKAMFTKVKSAGLATSTDGSRVPEKQNSNSHPRLNGIQSQPQAFQISSFQESPSFWPETTTVFSQTQPGGPIGYQPPSGSDMMGGITVPVELDWELWDNHFRNGGLSETPPDLWEFDMDVELPDSSEKVMPSEQHFAWC